MDTSALRSTGAPMMLHWLVILACSSPARTGDSDVGALDMGACEELLACVAHAVPEEFDAYAWAYGAEGSCWDQGDAFHADCRSACDDVLADLRSEYSDQVEECSTPAAAENDCAGIVEGPWTFSYTEELIDSCDSIDFRQMEGVEVPVDVECLDAESGTLEFGPYACEIDGDSLSCTAEMEGQVSLLEGSLSSQGAEMAGIVSADLDGCVSELAFDARADE